MKLPFAKFLEDNFPEVLQEWNLSEEEWGRLFYWYITNDNIFQFMRGMDMVGFVLFRPMRKEQLADRVTSFDTDPEGEYLYVPLFVTKKDWKGRGLWNMVKGLAKHTYPNIKYVAFESWKDKDGELRIVNAPEKLRKRKDHGKQVKA